MAESVNLSMLEFLAWISSRRRTYDEAMAAWQSTCPRHTVWEDATTDGLIKVGGDGVILMLRGRALLDEDDHRSMSR
ncbi:MAG: hypothetical protein ACREQ7_16045 [Candidatus Binatia bacterium]